MFTLLQSVKLLMLRCMTTPPALRLNEDDTATDDVVAINLYALSSITMLYHIKTRHIHWHGVFHPSLADCQIIRLIDDGISRYVSSVRDQVLGIKSPVDTPPRNLERNVNPIWSFFLVYLHLGYCFQLHGIKCIQKSEKN
ncbi:hypothetical protein TNCV_1728471 [Trichonephila clavipes]|nr:hypothetical protein TNCV_1728471 [Trichonephila clavipes]